MLHFILERALYKKLLPSLDLVIWAIKSDDRKYATSIDVYSEILKPNLENCPVIFAITQADIIRPHKEWNDEDRTPSENQKANLNLKVIDISSRFDVATNKIVAVSAEEAWNLVALINMIVSILPNEKKYSLTREAKPEYVSEEAAEEAERGFYEYIKEKAGKAWDYVKDDVMEAVIDAAKKYAPKVKEAVINVAKKWISSRFG